MKTNAGEAAPQTESPSQDKVRRSWARLREAGVDSHDELRRRMDVSPEVSPTLIKAVRRIGSKIRMIVGLPDTSACLLTDPNGVVAAFDGGERMTRELIEQGWVSGLSLYESEAGTNAVDLCLRDREPAVTMGTDHTAAAFHTLTLVARPLMVDSGHLVGALAMMLPHRSDTQSADAVLALCASLLEGALQADFDNDELERRLSEQKAIGDAMKDGTMVVNCSGLIEYMNAPAGRILKVVPEKAIGRKLADVVGFEPIINPVFESGVGYSDEELKLKSHGDPLHLIDTAVPVKDGAGRVVSVVNTFREFERVTRVAQRYGGNQAHYSFEDIVGEAPPLMTAIEIARKAAAGHASIMITGESGTGKELFAQAIHLASARADSPFVAINCAALPKDIIEAELFGYVPGSFTGALKSGRPGKFEIASGGTIFLDEIAEMPLDVQAKLLRVLQEREVTRLGSSDPTPVDIRLISATNANPAELIEKGQFREDLYYRINVIEVPVPSLRERTGDVRLLAHHYLKQYARSLNKPAVEFAEPVLEALERYDWPGNVRELQNAVERMVNLSDAPIIDAPIGGAPPVPRRHTSDAVVEMGTTDGESLPTLAEMERSLVSKALETNGYNVTRTARVLGTTKPKLYRMIRKYGISLERTARS